MEHFAAEDLSIKATPKRSYKFVHEDYIHEVEGESSVLFKITSCPDSRVLKSWILVFDFKVCIYGNSTSF